jgi:hypothetical protein
MIKDWLEESTPERREVQVCFDRALLSRLEAARKQLDAISLGQVEKMLGGSDEDEAKAHVSDIEEQIRAKTRTLVFEGLGWGKWRALLSEHPPTDDQADVFKRAVDLGYLPHSIINIGFNAETFVPAAISASCTSPGISMHEAETLLRKAPPGVLERVWTAVLEVNTAGGDDPFVVSPNGVSVGAPATAKR